MLTEVPGAAPGAYAFREGVRDVLLGTLPRTARGRTRHLLARVGGLIDERAGVTPGVLRAVAGGGAQGGEPFAEVSEDSARRLAGGRRRLFAGRYRLLHRMTSARVWLAEDTLNDRVRVLIQTYPFEVRSETILRNARLLSLVHHPGVATVTDYGRHGGVPYVVQQFVDGISLRELLREAPQGLPAERVLSLVPAIAEAVAVLHDHGIRHGALNPHHVYVTPTGPVLTVLDETPLGTASRADDFRALGELVREACLGTSAPDGAPDSSARLPDWLRQDLAAALWGLAHQRPDSQLHGFNQLRLLARGRHRYRLLGPVHVMQDEHPLVIGSPGAQAVLCMLLLHGKGGTVTSAELIRGLWSSRPPSHPDHTLRSHVSHLNAVLGAHTIVRHRDGYALPLDARRGLDVIDVFQFQRLGAGAAAARTAGETGRAHDLARSALALWRGEPLQGVPGPAARGNRAELLDLHNRLRGMLPHPPPSPSPSPRDPAGRPTP
ncbi:BTAD domain-containing putative transcriptional regulator [Streptomyces sp. G45]|uniref:BTAD domain-containing putative transcriptional regulator n=1 Tax=Streptomyces sp. G45 TaxID=3406627 RepID=UPI003C13AA37